MKKIDRATVQRIMDATDIVEVVSDYVSLKRRGANYVGLCPFHADRSPSFYVSKAKGICKCFSCGKGGSAINFLMELEQISYTEALRQLAKKYNIEIQERELTTAEQKEETDREAMMLVNDRACRIFEHNLTQTQAGRDIGLAYFHERGISQAMVEKFHLGYALEQRTDLSGRMINEGYKENYLIDTGLVTRTEDGRLYDRFRGRVIYPVFSVSGRVVAFGGRTLLSDKKIAKYVNSPESLIYSKRNELYGLYQAKHAINREKKCILVEGYMDVISMFQSGVENVVASSGTALTPRQVNLIHRFTDNVTVIYDSDAAGVKAALRGVDMLLSEGLNVKVVQFPPGEDPDSYAQSHSASQLKEYLAGNEVDFITFKIRILMEGSGNDPIARARAITDIVQTIAVIPSDITRAVYIAETARRLNIDEGVLTLQVAKDRAEAAKRNSENDQRQRQKDALDADPDTRLASPQQPAARVVSPAPTKPETPISPDAKTMYPFEEGVLYYALRYGFLNFCETYDEQDQPIGWMTVLQYIDYDLATDQITFTNPDIAHAMEAIHALEEAWQTDRGAELDRIEAEVSRRRRQGHDEIAAKGGDMQALHILEQTLEEQLAAYRTEATNLFDATYVSRHIINEPDDNVRNLATRLVADKYVLSKIHTKYAHVDTEQERLQELLPRALYELKDAVVACSMRRLRAQIAQASAADLPAMMQQLMDLSNARSELAKVIGERIINPRR